MARKSAVKAEEPLVLANPRQRVVYAEVDECGIIIGLYSSVAEIRNENICSYGNRIFAYSLDGNFPLTLKNARPQLVNSIGDVYEDEEED